MTRLALVALMSLILAGILCKSALVVAEAVAKASISRFEITQNP